MIGKNEKANEQYAHNSTSIVDQLIERAIAVRASDIHLEPQSDSLLVRFRVDGILTHQAPIPFDRMPEVISRIKVLSRLNIAEKRLPQDGKFSVTHNNRHIDFRISTFPSVFGEKIVIRILDSSSHAMALDQLGFSTSILTHFKQLIQRNSGLLLVTGPTGSGKTTTLYAALHALHSPDHNIITLEDPIEYSLPGITQGQVNSATGFTFEKGIRALLRQDPDILMVGEIRDKETARIAIEAALTGHLVLSTLHTNDAPSAIMRLMDMGIEPYLINASLIGVLAQRLARTLCHSCKQAEDLNTYTQLHAHLQQAYKPSGCNQCNYHGYKGRTGIFELLPLSDRLRSLIVSNPIIDAIRCQALDEGMQTLMHTGFEKVNEGIISLQDTLRIIS